MICRGNIMRIASGCGTDVSIRIRIILIRRIRDQFVSIFCAFGNIFGGLFRGLFGVFCSFVNIAFCLLQIPRFNVIANIFGIFCASLHIILDILSNLLSVIFNCWGVLFNRFTGLYRLIYSSTPCSYCDGHLLSCIQLR